YVPSTIHGVSRATLQNSLRETGLKLAAGIAAGFAAILAWGRLVLSSKEHENAVSSQITERYTKAVDQLGNNDPGVRLGGLYALERIALDSERDRPTICQVLSAYVRYHTSPEALEQTGRANPNVESLPKPALLVDVRAALSILTVPDRLWKVNIDLSNADLRGALLSG